jgi:hypothetical protein
MSQRRPHLAPPVIETRPDLTCWTVADFGAISPDDQVGPGDMPDGAGELHDLFNLRDR